ncbi:hypothetical protein ACQPYE_24400 [Actinosynnema sp. CA-299493]
MIKTVLDAVVPAVTSTFPALDGSVGVGIEAAPGEISFAGLRGLVAEVRDR